MQLRKLAGLLAFVVLAACSDPVATAASPDAKGDTRGPKAQKIRVDGHFLRDEQGRALLLHGVNVSSAAKYDPLHVGEASAQAFKTIADLGFDSVRLLTFWGAVMTAPPGATLADLKPDDAYLQRLDTMIAQASAAGLLVVLDMHQDLFGFGFGDNGAPPAACDPSHYAAYQPVEPWYANYLNPHMQACFDGMYADGPVRAAWAAAWGLLAQRYKGDVRIVGFDLLNEPHQGSADAQKFVPLGLFPFFRSAIDQIRAADPQRVVFVEPITSLLLSGNIQVAPLQRDQAVWAPHYYHVLVHDGAPYDPSTKGILLEQPIDRLAGAAQTVGQGDMPVWFGEFGLPAVAGDTLLLGQMLDRFDQHRASWCYWSWDHGGFSMLNGDGSLRKAALQVLLRPHARRIAGELLDSHYDAEKASLTVRYRTLPGDANATLLWPGLASVGLPIGASPHDVEVTSTDPAGQWSWDRQDRLVRVKHASQVAEHTVVLRVK
ncbi:MAG: cellulase family glycosylhydrolase [Deltaproteobacteria bacterium]|nr:cellulase family glycosylhydrolase [Deltaproteobacteria bacterium]